MEWNKYILLCCRFIKSFFLCLLVLSFICVVSTVNVCSYIGQNSDLISSINLHCSSELDLNNSAIINMDVSSNGYVAIALDNKSVLIYDNEGDFLKRFMFDSYGSYYIRWYNDRLELILVREDAIVEFTLDCKIVGLHYIDTSQIIKELKEKTRITVNNEIYEIKNKRFTGYATLTKTNESGVESALYSSNMSSTVKSVMLIAIFVLGFSIIPYVILSKQIKYVKERRQNVLSQEHIKTEM